MRFFFFLISLLPLGGTNANPISDVTIADLVGRAVCASEENPLEHYCFTAEAKRAERDQLANRAFGIYGVELIRKHSGAFFSFGLLQ
tara:strand:+ start:529 stop:789 length:261 start_codon:yes stop_codon:yes gene_type:complete